MKIHLFIKTRISANYLCLVRNSLLARVPHKLHMGEFVDVQMVDETNDCQLSAFDFSKEPFMLKYTDTNN